MTWTQPKVWACGLVALGLAVGAAAVAPRTARSERAAAAPGARQDAPPAKGGKPGPAKAGRDAELEALKQEIEALRKKVEALETKRPSPDRGLQKVVVTSPQVKNVVASQQYAGRVRSRRHITVRALATGVIEAVTVKEGQAVKKGEVLFRVLPVLYKARFEAERAEARMAQLELNNAKRLYEQKVVTTQEVALAEAKMAKAEAKVKLAEAELRFTEVTAPFDGLVGRLQEQEGSFVKQGDGLTTLSDNSVVWVYFDVPQARYLEYMAAREQLKAGPPIELVLANGKKFPQAGVLAAIEANFSETGSIAFRADFPNPEGLLRNGQGGTVLVRRELPGALVIPRRATFEILDGRYVYVVDKDNVAHRREVLIQDELDGVFVVKKGLGVNDKIVVDGVRQVRDGEKVEYEYRKPDEVLAEPNQPEEE